MIGKLIDHYLITAKLGSGSLGETFEAETPDRDKVTLKLVDRGLLQKPGFATQLKTLMARSQRLDAKHGLPYRYEVSKDATYLVTDYLPDGSLHSYLWQLQLAAQVDSHINWLSPQTAVALIYHILLRLRNYHVVSAGYKLHGALHPRNVLLTFQGERDVQPSYRQVKLQLSDFEHATLVRQQTAATDHPAQGLLPYVPIFTAGVVADDCADMYALGQLFYFLLHQTHLPTITLKPPAEDSTETVAEGYEEIDAHYQALFDKFETQPDQIGYIDRASFIALTAVRIYQHPKIDNYWKRWQYALEQLSDGRFELIEPTAFVPPDWPEISQPECAWPTDLEPVLFLPTLPTDEAPPTFEAGKDEPIYQRPLPSDTYIQIEHKPQNGSSAQPIRYYLIQPKQGRITIGSGVAADITLHDDNIQPRHVDLRRQSNNWRLTPHGSGVTLESTDESRGLWMGDIPLQIGNFTLTLHQPTTHAGHRTIGITVLPSAIGIQPGYKENVDIHIQNKDTERAYFKVSIKSAEAADAQLDNTLDNWFTLPHDGLVLNAREQMKLTLEIHPPLGTVNQTRPYWVVVERISTDPNQHIYHQQKGEVRVEATANYATVLEPLHSQGNGRYRLIIRNDSNQTLAFNIASKDPSSRLQFAEMATLIEKERPPESQPAAANGAKGTNGRAAIDPTLRHYLRRLWQRSEPGQQASRALSQASRYRHRAGQVPRVLGYPLPKTNLQLPIIVPRLRFEETFSLSGLVVKPQQQSVIFVAVQLRKRPLRWRLAEELPFAMVINPLQPPSSHQPDADTVPSANLNALGAAQEVTAVFHTAARLSRPASLLLTGLILLTCLATSILGAYQSSAAADQLRSAQTTAVAWGSQDTDKDGLLNKDETLKYQTDPQNDDTDGDSITDGVEISRPHPYTCPTSIDCNHNGVPDVVDLPYATPQPTQEPAPFPTVQPTPTPTLIPTITPITTATKQTVPEYTLTIPSTTSQIQLGDNGNNEQQIGTLTFDMARLPTRAQVKVAYLVIPLDNVAQYQQLQQRLGNIYITVNTAPFAEQFAKFQAATEEIPTLFWRLSPLPDNNNLLIGEIAPELLPKQDTTSIYLFFELATNLDERGDTLTIRASRPEQFTLYLLYTLPEDSDE